MSELIEDVVALRRAAFSSQEHVLVKAAAASAFEPGFMTGD
jgi:hypothetical protein